MNTNLLILCLCWLSSINHIQGRVKSNETDPQITLLEENDVRKLLVSASGEGDKGKTEKPQTKNSSNSTDDEEERKTLAQQVADGKYGLIQTELFSKPAKRPGIISYDVNPEVPKDNINNLGGLQADEIWLAENHLLVLKGGGFQNENKQNVTWKPIDNYVAPKRQVKIPTKPKVAPPFPIQLKEGGPIEFIQGEKNSFRPAGPPPFIPPNVKSNFSGPPPGFPFPFPAFGLPPPPPYPFPGNFTDIDEDDPRFYYPPPYDFVYDKDNSSHVAPGPLVPGIVLPPPVDFFAPLSSTTKRPAQKLEKRPPERDKTQKHNQIVNGFVPKRVSLTKPAGNTAPADSQGTKPKDKIKDGLPERKEKEGRKHVVTNRPPEMPPLSTVLKNPPEITTKTSRVVNTRPTEHTTAYPKLVITTIAPKIKTPKITQNDWVPIVGAPVCPPGDPNCFDYAPVKYDNRYNHISLLFNATNKPNDYVTENPNINSVTRNKDYYSINNNPRQTYITTTTNPYYDLKPIIVPTTVTTAAYKSVDSNKYNPGETYYVYEDPIVPGAKVILKDYNPPNIRNGPTIVYVNHDVHPKYELNTVSPLQVLREQTVKKPRLKVKNKPSPLELFESELSTITNSNKFSISYSEGDGQPDINQIAGYSYPSPLDEALDNIIKNSHSNNYKNKKGRMKEVKTPVFEYSFSAPGYGQNESPKISSGIPSTEKPESSLHQPQYSFFGFDSRPVADPIPYNERNTEAPINYTPKTKYRKVILDQLNEFLATEVPYTQIYTPQEPEVLDDITKNYFTLFGKKINQDTYSKYVTTPLPPQANENENIYYEQAKTRQRTSKGPKRQNIRFPEETANIQNINNQKDEEYDVRAPNGNGNPAPRPQGNPKPNNYNNRYYNNFRPKYYHRDYSLASDVNVNYKKPFPPINPDAELIDPTYIHGENHQSNSYISYQLPGNGGHFYFLTPQNIHATNYHLANSGVRFPHGYNRVYYKRNAQSMRNRRWTNK